MRLAIGADLGHRRREDTGVRALRRAEGVGGDRGLEVGGDTRRHPRPPRAARRRPGRMRQAGALEQGRREAQPDGGVVVAAGQHHLGAGIDEARDGLGQQGDGVRSGQGSVVHVPGDEDGIHGLGPHRLDKVVDEGRLGVEEPHLVEGPAQVPVGRVDEAHVTQAREAADSPSFHRACPGSPERIGTPAGAGILWHLSAGC